MPTTINQLIKRIRQENGLTQSELAIALGVTQAYISKIERGDIDYKPSDRFLYRVSQKFNKNLTELLEMKNGKQPTMHSS